MKVGILTLGLSNNYGNILQAYALQTILRRMVGDDNVEIISLPYIKKLPNRFIRPLVYLYRRLLLKLGLADQFIRADPHIEEFLNNQRKHLAPFVSRYLKLFEINSYKNIKYNDFDVIVVGSDQVWRPVYWSWQSNNITDAFLGFAEKWEIRRIAYAPSFGTDNWEFDKKQTFECKRLIKLFDFVSCREEEGVRLCQEKLDYKNAVCVIDPTMLLKAEDYMQFVVRDTPSKNKLLVYMLDIDRDKQLLIDTIAEEKQLIPFSVFCKNRSPLSLEQWLQQFNDAEFIVTDSFHACVFSIIFKKPFIVYGNKERGMSRFATLLRKFHLEDRLLTSYSEYKELKIKSKISDASIELENQRIRSINWLKNSINQ